MKIIPALGALPAKLNPPIENTDSTSGTLHQHLLRLLDDVGRVLQRRAGRRLHHRMKYPASSSGHERLRDARVDDVGQSEQPDEQDHHRPADPDEAAHRAHVEIGPAVDDALDRAEEVPLAHARRT